MKVWGVEVARRVSQEGSQRGVQVGKGGPGSGLEGTLGDQVGVEGDADGGWILARRHAGIHGGAPDMV
ncbi:MAG: hypothetical protein H0U02_02600 [Rubrobacter sp.]|nr:hypothetical protein [Rubrobacter sp.]